MNQADGPRTAQAGIIPSDSGQPNTGSSGTAENGGGQESEPPTIYQEMYTGALYLDKPAGAERFDAAFEAIWNTALDQRSSRNLISRTAEDMRDG